jgi:ribonucleoside-diphosphate reductase alpha chain
MQKKSRPKKLSGQTICIETPVGKTFVTINQDDEGQPFEVFVNAAKAGSEITAVSEAIGRLISLVLRVVSTDSPRDRLAEVYDQLSSIGGSRSMGFGPNRIQSLPDGISKALVEYLQLELPETGEVKDLGHGEED